jgi:hypothetical protein
MCVRACARVVVPQSAAEADDDDVAAERQRVMSGAAANEVLVVKELNKQYGDGKVAVERLTFGIPVGQCFGFLVRLLVACVRCSLAAARLVCAPADQCELARVRN